MNTPSSLSVPSPGSDDPQAMLKYLRNLDLQLRQIISFIHSDLSEGNMTLSVLDNPPEVDDLGEGQMIIYDEHIYVRLNNSLYKTQLTEVI